MKWYFIILFIILYLTIGSVGTAFAPKVYKWGYDKELDGLVIVFWPLFLSVIFLISLCRTILEYIRHEDKREYR